MLALKTALAACPAFQDLLDDPAAAADHIEVGEAVDPWRSEGDGAASRDHLERLLCRAFIELPDDVVVEALTSPDTGASGCPEETWDVKIRLRRQARDAEIEINNGEGGFYLAFADRALALPHCMVEKLMSPASGEAYDRLRIAGYRVGWVHPDQEAAQGLSLWWEADVTFNPDAGGE